MALLIEVPSTRPSPALRRLKKVFPHHASMITALFGNVEGYAQATGTTVEEAERGLSNLALLMTITTPQHFHRNAGRACPVAPDTRVAVQLRGGAIEHGQAGAFHWGPDRGPRGELPVDRWTEISTGDERA